MPSHANFILVFFPKFLCDQTVSQVNVLTVNYFKIRTEFAFTKIVTFQINCRRHD